MEPIDSEAKALFGIIEYNFHFSQAQIEAVTKKANLSEAALIALIYLSIATNQYQITDLLCDRIKRRASLTESSCIYIKIISSRASVKDWEIVKIKNDFLLDPSDKILKLLADRVVERLCGEKRFQEAYDLLNFVNKLSTITNDRDAIRHLVQSIVSYRLGLNNIDTLIAKHQPQLVTLYPAFPLAYSYNAIFLSFLTMLKSGARHQVNLSHSIEKCFEKIGCPITKTKLTCISNSLSHAPGSLPSRIWSLVPPSELKMNQDKKHHFSFFNPESLFFDQAHSAIQDLESLHSEKHLEKLESAVKQARLQGADCWADRLSIQILLIHLNSVRLLNQFERSKLRLFAASYKNHEISFFLKLLECSFAYRNGQKKQFLERLSNLLQHPHHGISRDILTSWHETVSGKNKSKLNYTDNYTNRLTRLIFSPRIEKTGESSYQIGEIDYIDLQKKPILKKILEVITQQKDERIKVEELQEIVWGQATSLEGWRQKIRNSISRLRYEFRFILLPFLYQTEGVIELNSLLLLKNRPTPKKTSTRNNIIFMILEREQLTSRELAIRTRIPHPTVKRIIRKGIKDGYLQSKMTGKTFIYTRKTNTNQKS